MKTDQNRLIMSMLSNGNGNHGNSKSISPSSTGSLNLKKSFRIDDLLSKKSARCGSPSGNNHYSSNHSNNSEESLQENDGSPSEGVRSQNQSHHQYNHRRGDHEQDHHNNNSHHHHYINSQNNTKNNNHRIEADYPQERDRERDRDRDRERRGSTKMISIVGKSDYANQALITSRYSQSSDRDRERDRDRDHPGLLRPNNSYHNNNNNNWEDEHHVNSLKLTELRKSYQQHHQQESSQSQQQATYSMGRYEFDPNHHHHHPQSVRTSSPGSGSGPGPGPGPIPPTIPLPPLYLPEALAPPPPLSFSSMSQLTHYQEALQRYNDYITANNNASQIQIQQNPFAFYSSPSPNNPLHHPALSMSTLSAFRSLYPSAGPGDPLASLSPDDLATARNSFSHSTNGLYAAASLAYLGRNPPSFSMPSLLGHNDGNKRKGGQIRFTNYQTSQLEKSFMDHKYLNANDRKKLATSLGLSDRQVKTWFQNRRAKWRKCKEIHCQDIEGEMNKCSSSDRQSYSPDPGNCESPATSGPEDDEHSP